MLVGKTFYFGTIRKVSVAFASIFNNIHVSRYTNSGGKGEVLKTIKVPLYQAAGEKWYVNKRQDVPAQSNTQVRMTYPRISLEMSGMQYDPSRKLQTTNQIGKFSQEVDSSNVRDFLRQLNPVPYDFQYDVHIAVKNIDDGLQILEQILPYFSPSFNLVVKDIPELALTKDVSVIFAGITSQDTYEGSFEEKRILTWTLSFVVKAYLYPPISDGDIIRKVITSIYSEKDLRKDSKTEAIVVKVDPIDANKNDDWKALTHIYTEFDSNGEIIEDDSNG